MFRCIIGNRVQLEDKRLKRGFHAFDHLNFSLFSSWFNKLSGLKNKIVINWRYAIGEIIIVIVGVSAAFALNNWAENRKDKRIEKLYLANIKSDLQRDLEILEHNTSRLEKKLETVKEVLPLLRPLKAGQDTVSLKFFSLSDPINFYPKDATYRTLVNSGDLKVITDFKVKSNIEEFYGSYNTLLKDYERFEYFSKEFIADFYVHQIDWGKVRSGNYDFLESKTVRNMTSSMFGIFKLKLESTKTAMEQCKSLIALIDTQLAS